MSTEIIDAEQGYGFTVTRFAGGAAMAQQSPIRDVRCYQINAEGRYVVLNHWQMSQLVGAFTKSEERGNDLSNAKAVLTTLENTNGYVTLALEIAGELVPLGKALVQGVKQLGQGGNTETYQVLLQMDAAELDAIDKLSLDDLTAINAELVKLGLQPVPLPAPPGGITQ